MAVIKRKIVIINEVKKSDFPEVVDSQPSTTTSEEVQKEWLAYWNEEMRLAIPDGHLDKFLAPLVTESFLRASVVLSTDDLKNVVDRINVRIENLNKTAVEQNSDSAGIPVREVQVLPDRSNDPVGPYWYENNAYRVRRAKRSNQLYAQKFVPPLMDVDGNPLGRPQWPYAPNVVFKLKTSDRMTLDKAKEIGAAFKFCINCGRMLTDPKSIERSIGPVCIKRYRT